ncbi:unnamed protein product (mitochondrion) [Plasmodiophora brassicae]|uniref:Choline transporter-like protein n=1 Tax=Plasmodiophora brassicae TaxID=37360 RepID=A0A0G4IHV0_PLABS|nr:hypothetical protein PBRA_003572 [Plasmodiophora brassicae]SPQ98720.1 unnamed protein product [Plasmodiophora brassicae]
MSGDRRGPPPYAYHELGPSTPPGTYVPAHRPPEQPVSSPSEPGGEQRRPSYSDHDPQPGFLHYDRPTVFPPSAPPIWTQTPQSNADHEYARKFKFDRPFQDGTFLLAFLVHLGAMIGLAIAYLPPFIRDIAAEERRRRIHVTYGDVKDLGIVLGVGTVTGACAAAAWMSFARRFADSIISVSLTLSIVFCGILSVASLLTGQGWAALGFGLTGVLTALYYYYVRHRIQFAASMLEMSIMVIHKYSGPVYIAFSFILLQMVWVAFWSATSASVAYALSRATEAGGDKAYGVVVFALLVSLYWTLEVLSNIVHVTTAGVAASWWFFPDLSHSTRASFVRASTTSLGSVCFGSLIVALISALEAIVRLARTDEDNNNNCLQQILLAIVQCAEDLAKYFNVYAFSRVAIYGKSFTTSGRETWDMFRAKGIDMVINDDLTGHVLALGALFGFGISACSAAVVALFVLDNPYDGSSWLYLGLIAGVLGYAIVYLVMNVLRSCVATFFVCWAEDANALRISRPRQYEKLRNNISYTYPGLSV